MAFKKKRSISDMIDEYFENAEEWADQFEQVLIRRPSWNQKACSIEPLRDIAVAPTEVVITVDLPLTEESTVQAKPVDDRTVEISAKMRRKMRFEEFGVIHHKGEFHTLHCHIRIPVPVHMDKMKIQIKKGILKICLPRKH